MKILVLLAAAAIVSCNASAQLRRHDGLRPESHPIHSSMEEALKAAGLDKFVSEKNNRTMNAISHNIESIKGAAGDKFSGSWIEYDKNNDAHQFIATTEPIKLDLEKIKFPENLIKMVIVKYSLADLTKTREKYSSYSIQNFYRAIRQYSASQSTRREIFCSREGFRKI